MNTLGLMNQKIEKRSVHDPKGAHSLSRGSGLAVAMALGASLGVPFAPKEGIETRKNIMEKAQELEKKLKKSSNETQETLKNIFGKVTKELKKNYLELQEDILAHLDDLRDKIELTQKEYEGVVQNAVKHFSKGKKWTQKSIKALIKELQKKLR